MKRLCLARVTRVRAALFLAASMCAAQQEDPFSNLPAPPARADDASSAESRRRPWLRGLFRNNFGFRKEVMSQFTSDGDRHGASRQSVGFEILKKFSTETATVASFNVQARLVRRDGFNPVQNDMEGENRPGWALEYHNFYLDLYNVLNPLLPGSKKGRAAGRFNFRAGRFYVPFGLNLQTDTHGSILQLSNDRNFGFERDWYSGFWGSINSHLNYDAYYAAGSGYPLSFRGQKGLGAFRLSLGNRYSSRFGVEGGVSVISGERLPRMEGHMEPIPTRRAGGDVRYRRAVPAGLLTLTTEMSRGGDSRIPVTMRVHQGEYTHSSRRWGAATQYRRFHDAILGPDASIIGEFTWYFRNDVGNSSLHWIKFNVERRIGISRPEPLRTVFALQYYFYR